MVDRTLTTNTQAQSMGVCNIATGKWVSDAGASGVAMTFTIGFTPRYVSFVNATDRITDEWYSGMAADSAVETAAAGTRTLETSGGVTVTDGKFTVHADLVPASKTGYWVALG
jgi:hypothetical protein